MNGVRTYLAQAAAAVRVSAADRTNFLLQCAGMIVNNGFVLALWFMFFKGFESIGGWRMPDMALVIGLLATVVGLAGFAFGGYRDMAAAILRGEPDALLTQPRTVFWRLLALESSIPSAGDLVTGVVLLAAFARIGWAELPWLGFALACGLVIYLAMATSFASLAFWARGARSFARDLTDFVIMFSSYPGSIYSGSIRLVVFTVFPAGFIVLTPVALLRHPTLAAAAALLAAALAYAAFAGALFSLGLRRHRRGEAPAAA